jgi:hypothetical protein
MSRMISRLFTDHPRAIGETYGEHARTAWSFGWRMTLGGIACMGACSAARPVRQDGEPDGGAA